MESWNEQRACMQHEYQREECPYQDPGFMEAYGKGEVGDATDWVHLVAQQPLPSPLPEREQPPAQKRKKGRWPVPEASEGGAAGLRAQEGGVVSSCTSGGASIATARVPQTLASYTSGEQLG
ncbi:hypothetical protein EOD39_11234 [Acipenser ruthenus]|uniref:Uncharacterized protein n=1 Tax=Acipenser ruthenus TaxID=7906 RepID=A0A662YSM7_ACIRT|nr:hypothetical protein EOD39_11234 [Acipenser ruthenus]